MTLEDIVSAPASLLEGLSDEELTKLLSPYWSVTRPEIVKQTKTVAKKPISPAEQEKIERRKKAQLLMNMMMLNTKPTK